MTNYKLYTGAKRLLAMQRYGRESLYLYVVLPLNMQRSCFRIQTQDQTVTEAQLYRYAREHPLMTNYRNYNFVSSSAAHKLVALYSLGRTSTLEEIANVKASN
ncbi:hypothetical protein HKD37_02G004078 [Glycine soja]